MNRTKTMLAIGAFMMAGGRALADSSIYVESGADGETDQDYTNGFAVLFGLRTVSQQ